MKLGFITNAFAWAGQNDLMQIGRWAADHGFTDLEIGPSIPLDVSLFQNLAQETGIRPTSFIYCRNFLDPENGFSHCKELEKRIRFAASVGAEKVICTTGITPDAVVDSNVLRYDPEACIDSASDFLGRMAAFAGDLGIKLALELCPMMHNIAISPYMLSKVLDAVSSPHLGIAFDPSHLVWEMIDPMLVLEDFSDKIFHVHGKDAEILWDKLRHFGILHTTHKFDHPVDNGEGIKEYDSTWYRYRLPGLGSLDWSVILDRLKEIGFDGTISIEHEDPVWCGSLEKISAGIDQSAAYLRECMKGAYL